MNVMYSMHMKKCPKYNAFNNVWYVMQFSSEALIFKLCFQKYDILYKNSQFNFQCFIPSTVSLTRYILILYEINIL